MKKMFGIMLLSGVFLTGAIVLAQETSKPTTPPRAMGPMTGTMGEGSPMKSMDHGAMMDKMEMMRRMHGMHGMQGMQGMAKMMENCREMMEAAQRTEPSGDK